MENKKIDFSSKITEEEIYITLTKSMNESMTDWFEFQAGWLNRAYKAFNDLDKYLILIHIFYETINSYSEIFVKKSFDEFYAYKEFEVKKYNISKISLDLNISKETVRRKIIELEKQGTLTKNNKILKLNQRSFQIQKPSESVNSISRFISNFSKQLEINKFSNKKFSQIYCENIIKKNFTLCWNFFLSYQIPNLINWKKFYNNDPELYYIVRILMYNQNLNVRKIFPKEIKKDYYKYDWLIRLLESGYNKGMSAMTISDITGIPRPTVIRKLKKEIKSYNYVKKDKNNFYYLTNDSVYIKNINSVRLSNLKRLSVMMAKLFNVIKN